MARVDANGDFGVSAGFEAEGIGGIHPRAELGKSWQDAAVAVGIRCLGWT
jgi:hypothetical protein